MRGLSWSVGSAPIWGAEMPAPHLGPPAGRRLDRRGACVCRLVTRRHRPHNPRSNPEPTCPQTSVIASHAQVCSRRRVCVWPLISSTHGVMGLRIAAPPFAVSTLYNAHVRVLAWMGRHRAVCSIVFDRGSIVGLHSFIRDLGCSRQHREYYRWSARVS